MQRFDRNWVMTTLGLLVLCIQPQACRDEVSSHPLANHAGVETYLQQDVSTLISQHLLVVDQQLLELHDALRVLQGNIEQESAWSDVQIAWTQTMISWQPLEMMQIASLGSSMSVIGGEDLRDEIYSWPLVNPCRIDQVTATSAYQAENFIENSIVSVRGLDTVEYLIFGELDTTCPSQVPPVSDGAWASLSEREILERRVAYALIVVSGVQEHIDMAQAQWSTGFPMGMYESPIDGLNAVFDAMLYMEEGIKERKLHYPMGLTTECSEDCHLAVEGYWASVSGEFLLANMQGMTGLLEGVDNTQTGGLIGILRSIDEGELAEELQSIHRETLQQVIVLQDLEQTMSEMVLNPPEELIELSNLLSAYTSLLKWDVAAILELQIPQGSAGDND